MEGSVECSDKGNSHSEGCLDAFQGRGIMEGSQRAKLPQLVQQRDVHAHHVAQPVASMDHPVCNSVW